MESIICQQGMKENIRKGFLLVSIAADANSFLVAFALVLRITVGWLVEARPARM